MMRVSRKGHPFVRGLVLGLCVVLMSACGEGGIGLDDAGDGDVPGGGQAAQKPTSLPTFASLSLYSSDSPLNQRIPDGAEVDPDSDNYMAVLKQIVNEGGIAIELKQYSTPVYLADSSTPKVAVQLACGQEWAGVSTLSGVPIPAFAEPAQDTDGSSNPIPKGQCGEFSDQDNQMVILDLATRCEYDFLRMRVEDGNWVADWGNSISMNSTGIYEKGFSARGAGFTQLAGEIWPDELLNGRIGHALIFAIPGPATGGPVAPATESDGISDAQWALPEGALIQLDPDLDLAALGLTAYERTIAVALQEYGMYLVDVNSTGISLEAIYPRSVLPNPYDGLLPDEDYPELPNIPAESFRVLKLPPQNATYDEDNELVASGCATFG